MKAKKTIIKVETNSVVLDGNALLVSACTMLAGFVLCQVLKPRVYTIKTIKQTENDYRHADARGSENPPVGERQVGSESCRIAPAACSHLLGDPECEGCGNYERQATIDNFLEPTFPAPDCVCGE